jgi:hypothetical protein
MSDEDGEGKRGVESAEESELIDLSRIYLRRDVTRAMENIYGSC